MVADHKGHMRKRCRQGCTDPVLITVLSDCQTMEQGSRTPGCVVCVFQTMEVGSRTRVSDIKLCYVCVSDDGGGQSDTGVGHQARGQGEVTSSECC